MSEQPVTVEQQPEEGMSFMDKAAGVFYEPSKVFESIKSSGVKFADWFVPVLLSAILAGVSIYVVNSNPDLRYQTLQIMEQSIDKSASEGKMTADQAQQAKTAMENNQSAFMGIQIVGALFVVFIFFFILSAIWLTVAKFALKGTMTYTQVMGVVGLVNWISVVGLIIGIVLTVALSRLNSGLNLGLLSPAGSLTKSHILLSKIDLFTIWTLVLTSIGLGKLANRKTSETAIWVFGLWIIWGLFGVFVLGGKFFA